MVEGAASADENGTEDRMTWVQTHTGIAFDLLNPRAEDVNIDDILHALSRIPRFSGATRGDYGYTVAQHSLLVADLVASWGAPPELVREALLHDASEAYYGDITAPVQRALRVVFRDTVDDLAPASHPSPLEWAANAIDPLVTLKRSVDAAVRSALGLPAEESPLVRRADLVALAIERRDLMAPCVRDWQLPEFAPTGVSIERAVIPLTAHKNMRERLAALDALARAAK